MFWATFLFAIGHVSAQDELLVLTDYIDAGNATGAKLASKVTSEDLLASQVESYSGYFRISTDPFRNLFFWFFPCQNEPQTKPLILWLQGGPGESGMIGIMEEFGLFALNENSTAVSFSNSTSNNAYTATVGEVADHLYEALTQFFTVFTEFQTNDFYIAGESYAGKYVPTLAKKIEESNSTNINLKDLLIFSGLIDPTKQLRASLVLRQWGLIDNRTAAYLEDEEEAVANLVVSGDNLSAESRWFRNFVLALDKMKYSNFYDVQRTRSRQPGDPSELFVSMPAIKQALHVGNVTFKIFTSPVRDAMRADFMNSAKQTLEDVLPNRKVLFVNGNLDLMVPPVFNEEMLSTIEPAYNASVRTFFRQDDEVVGYIKKGDNLVTAVLRNCGHYLSIDCPRPAKEIVQRFLAGTL
ncbi:putative serine carboxypeptidase CPVL [Blattella germanica]|nr:putative serine carboxypeptidase CPVL [Blattella germanica]